MAAACLARSDGEPLELNIELTFEATVRSVATASVGPSLGSCVQYITDDHLSVELEDEMGETWTLQAQAGGLTVGRFEQGMALQIGYRDNGTFAFDGPQRVITIHRDGSLEWFAMTGLTPHLFTIPGFDIVLSRGEAYCESTECTYLAARATASLDGTTETEACGAELGDFAVYQAYRVSHNDQSGSCDVTGEIDWTSGIRIR